MTRRRGRDGRPSLRSMVLALTVGALVTTGCRVVQERSALAQASAGGAVAVSTAKTAPPTNPNVTIRRLWAGEAYDFVGSAPSPDGRYVSWVDWLTGDLSVRDLASGRLYHVREPRQVPGIDHPVGELLVRGPTISPGYAGQDEIDVDEEGFYHTGDLAWVDEDRWVYLVGREKELIHWDDGTLIDPMHLSNLLVRSIWVKDALVTRLGEDDFLSVFLFPDWPRVEKDAGFREAVANGVRREEALRVRLLEAVDYAQALSQITPRLGRDRLYLLAHKLERTPTHKIKFLRALETLDLGSYV